MDAIRSGNFSLGATTEIPQEREPETALQNPIINAVSDVMPTAGIKRNFSVTFDGSQHNTKRLSQLMESISSSLTHSELPVREEQIILQLLNQINDNIVSLQRAEVPESALTKTFAREVINRVIKNSHIPEHLQQSVDKLFDFFAVCKYFDFFMYGAIDQKLCGSLAVFLSTIPEDEPLEIMAGAGWLQKGLRDQGRQIRSTDNFKINASSLYQDQLLAVKIFNITGMREHVQNFAVIEGATVEKMDALRALEASSSRVVIMCWPELRPKELIYEIMEHCYKNQKLIIHIANEDESLSKMVMHSGHGGDSNCFIPVKNAPSSHAHLECMTVGFWKQVPKWFEELESQRKKESRPDFMIRHFKP